MTRRVAEYIGNWPGSGNGTSSRSRPSAASPLACAGAAHKRRSLFAPAGFAGKHVPSDDPNPNWLIAPDQTPAEAADDVARLEVEIGWARGGVAGLKFPYGEVS